MSFIRNIDKRAATDHELVQLYKKEGDIRILAQLYQRYMDLLYAVCFKYLKDTEESKDAVMSIFEELVSKLLKHEVTHFSGWLYRLAVNHCLMQIRRRKQLTVVSDPEIMQLTETVHLDGVFEKENRLNLLTKCIEGLSQEQNQSVRLFYLEQKCYKEIAEITQNDWNKVRSLIQNARRNLKICMEKNGVTGEEP